MGLPADDNNIQSRESGVALVFVLLIFAIITVVAADIATRLYYNTEKQSRYLQYVQARHYALGAEHYVALLLEEDKRNDKKEGRLVDHWFESWAGANSRFDVDEGEIFIQVLDDQGRFNLNLLADGQNKEVLEVLIRILYYERIDPRLAYRIRDWIDAGQTVSGIGAEDGLYLAASPPYRTGDTLMASVSELKLLQVLTPDEYARLLPHVTVLPDSKAGLNINTMTARLFQSLSGRISETDARAFVDVRGRDAFSDLDAFRKHPLIKGKIDENVFKKLNLDVKSHFFSVYIKAVYRDVTFYLHSRLARNDEGKVTVTGRELGVSPKWVTALRESVR